MGKERKREVPRSLLSQSALCCCNKKPRLSNLYSVELRLACVSREGKSRASLWNLLGFLLHQRMVETLQSAGFCS